MEKLRFWFWRLMCVFGWHNCYIEDGDWFTCPCQGETFTHGVCEDA